GANRMTDIFDHMHRAMFDTLFSLDDEGRKGCGLSYAPILRRFSAAKRSKVPGVRTSVSPDLSNIRSYTTSHTPLKRSTRRVRIVWPPAFFQRMPDTSSRCVKPVLHAASVPPLPSGPPCCRYTA